MYWKEVEQRGRYNCFFDQFSDVCHRREPDRRRLKVMKTLEGFGARVQYSVFECRLKPAEIAEMRRQLKKTVEKFYIDKPDHTH